MTNLIYQYWDGNVKDSVKAGSNSMRKYAEVIGSEYMFEDNPRYVNGKFGYYSAHYGALKPVMESQFDKYDNILFADTDVFPVDGLTQSIFDDFTGDIGICTEPFQPKQRQITLGRITSKSDAKWAKVMKNTLGIDVPRTEEGLVTVYNTGVVLYNQKARKYAQENWLPFEKYVSIVKNAGLDSFYSCDQPYIHAMMFYSDLNIQEMDNGWNSYIHGTKDKIQPNRRIVDHRDDSTKFVHCQFPGADNMNAKQLWTFVNLPRDQWDYNI
jgi:hypothetical protein